MKLKVVQKGTHYVAIKDINNDIPPPPSFVAEYLGMLEYELGEMVKGGGNDPEAVKKVTSVIQMLNTSLRDAFDQNWKLELEP